jgi:hypothetical protein
MMMFISTQAPDLEVNETAALVDIIDDVPFELIEPTVLPAPAAHLVDLPTAEPQPVGHCHELSVFRPPRAALA